MTTHSFKPKSAWYYFLSATVCYEDLNASNGTGSDQVAVFISKNWVANLAEIGVNYFQGTNIVTYNGLTDPCVIVSGVVSSDGDDSFAVRAFQDDVNPTPIRAGSLFSGFQIGGGGGGGATGGGLKICGENENCPWTVLLCWLVSPEPTQIQTDVSHIVSSFASNRPITFWTWGNTQCGRSGTGWHVAHATCSTGQGTWFGKCQWVLVDTGGGGSTAQWVLHTCYLSRAQVMASPGANYFDACKIVTAGGWWKFTGAYMTGQYGDTSGAVCSKMVYDGSTPISSTYVCPTN